MTPKPSGSAREGGGVHVHRGYAWLRKGELRPGHRRLHRGHPARPERPAAHKAAGGLVKKNDLDKAIADYSEAIRLDPRVRRGLRDRGTRLGEQE